MKRYITLLLIICPLMAFMQDYSICKIYQYLGDNESDTTLAAIEYYNERGQMLKKRIIKYKHSSIAWIVPMTFYYEYINNKLIKETKVVDYGDSVITFYHYDQFDRLYKKQELTYSSIPGQQKVWSYRAGELLLYYEYDENNRISEVSYRNLKNKVLRKDIYTYDDLSYTVVSKLRKLFWFRKGSKMIFSLDNFGNIIQKKMVHRKTGILFTIDYNRDAQGRLRKQLRKEPNEASVTSVYVYE